jgi:putative acyl-CoA dehydrogenase
MQNVLADLALESEASTTLALRLARAYDHPDDEFEVAFRRVATAVSKYYVNKRLPAAVGEALECLGGAGYVEESIMPRLFRESPLNGIWEGSGNVICLDVLRAMSREPAAVDAFFAECETARGNNAYFDAAFDGLASELQDLDAIEGRARRIVEQMAVVLQASLLLRVAPAEVSDAFCRSRLDREYWAFGTLPPGLPLETLIARALPQSSTVRSGREEVM